MVQIIPAAKTKGERLSEGIGRGLEFGGQLMQQHEAKQALNAENQALKQNYGIDLSGVADPKQRQQIVAQMLQGKGQDIDEDPRVQKISEYFGPEAAEIYKSAPEGGKTEIIKHLLESTQRGEKFSDRFSKKVEEMPDMEEGRKLPAEMSDEEKQEQTFKKKIKELVASQDVGLTPAEKVKRGAERFTSGLKTYEEAGTKLKKATRDRERLDILDDLSKSKKLPKDFGRLNVDSEGNLRFPFATTPEAQRYVKTLNEFSEGAKDSYGSRVTNFDLQQYFKRFPNLLNSEEGRKQILQQMKIVNDINAVYYKNLRKIYDQAGGVRKIDADIAEGLADQMSEGEVSRLSDKFKEIGQFSSKPAASEFSGKKIRDKETGEMYQSNGSEWIKV